MKIKLLIPLFWLFAGTLLGQSTFTVEKSEDGVRVNIGNELFTEYLIAKPSPILWPLMAPGGVKMTRDYPMLPTTEGEKHDHPHHRSMWFTHGAINGVDFWHKGGRVEHVSFGKIEGGPTAVIHATNAWIDDKDQHLLTDKRRMTFGADDQSRWVDIDAIFKAEVDEVSFGDTKEGTFAVRVAETMKVDAKLGGKIVNSEGLVDSAAWGKPANWVDYTGPVNNQTYGIAIFCHPATFNYPNRWHVRTYGLFAANPFGLKDFAGGEAHSGIKLKRSKEMRFRYRILLHSGPTDSEKLNQVFDQFSKTNFPEL